MLDSAATAMRPLVLEFESALLRTNWHDEALLDSLRTNPLHALAIALGLMKPDLALSLGHADAWPVRQDVVEYARQHAQAGGLVAIATGGDRALAERVRARFPFITEVICTAAAASPADALHRRFPQGFAYAAGGAEGDREVWDRGADCVLVGATSAKDDGGAREITPVAVVPGGKPGLSVLRRSLRLHQWAKNGLIFVPLVLGGKANDPAVWLVALLGFIALGCVASATYLLNDLWDLPGDRTHWSKYKRPLASGELPIRTALAISALGLAAGFLIAALLSKGAVAGLAAYLVLTLAYSFAFKRVPVLDVLVLASLFTMRLGVGVVLSDVRLSPWLLVFSMFTFLSLSLAKRHTEVARMAAAGKPSMSGRGYLATDGPFVLGLGMASAMGSVLILILYLIEDAFPEQFYHQPYMLWAIPPLLFLFMGRIWLLCQRDQLSDDPVAFALKDKTCLLIGALGGLAFLVAIA